MKSAGKIPVIADVPRREPGLGFREYAEAIADAVRGGEPPQFTIGVYGPWGSGKSSLLNAIADNLESEDTSVIPVRFDAWRHERAEHIIVPILHAIYDSVRRRSDPSLVELMKKAISAVVFSSTFSLDKVGMKVSLIR